MIKIRVYTVHEDKPNNQILFNAVMRIKNQYPDVSNSEDGRNNKFDRLFEELNPGCQVIYGPPCYVIWENDVDYTAFLLKWS